MEIDKMVKEIDKMAMETDIMVKEIDKMALEIDKMVKEIDIMVKEIETMVMEIDIMVMEIKSSTEIDQIVTNLLPHTKKLANQACHYRGKTLSISIPHMNHLK